MHSTSPTTQEAQLSHRHGLTSQSSLPLSPVAFLFARAPSQSNCLLLLLRHIRIPSVRMTRYRHCGAQDWRKWRPRIVAPRPHIKTALFAYRLCTAWIGNEVGRLPNATGTVSVINDGCFSAINGWAFFRAVGYVFRGVNRRKTTASSEGGTLALQKLQTV